MLQPLQHCECLKQFQIPVSFCVTYFLLIASLSSFSISNFKGSLQQSSHSFIGSMQLLVTLVQFWLSHISPLQCYLFITTALGWALLYSYFLRMETIHPGEGWVPKTQEAVKTYKTLEPRKLHNWEGPILKLYMQITHAKARRLSVELITSKDPDFLVLTHAGVGFSVVKLLLSYSCSFK